LAENDYEVHVVHSDFNYEQNSLWLQDVQHKNIHTNAIKSNYPSILNKTPNSLFGKIQYWLALRTNKFKMRGSPYDKAELDIAKFLFKSREIIKKENISNLVISTAPFSLADIGRVLKMEFSLNYILDIRDPWTWGHGYGFSSISLKRFKFEKERERDCMKYADHILVPVEIMKQKMVELYSEVRSKILVFPNGFDQEEIIPDEILSRTKKIIFFGSLYNGIENYFMELANQIQRYKNDYQLHIYSDSTNYIEFFKNNNTLGNNVFYFKSVHPNRIFKEIKKSNFVLFVHPEYGINNISTKFYEVIKTRTPIIYLGEIGKGYDFIKNNKLGVALTYSQLEKGGFSFLTENYHVKYNKGFDVDNFDFKILTNKLIQILK
tara:strand:- start:3036 stop:4169 length:1134 start_codon:yes stop_codon:yes gene_type:complete